MNRKKSFFTVLISMILLLGLLAGAIRFPKIMADFQDNKLLEQLSEKEFSFSTYQLNYESVSDKLYAIAYVISQGLQTDYLWVNEANVEEPVSNARLTEYVSEELDKLLGKNVGGISFSISEDELEVRELLTLYAGLEEYNENLLSGIQVYRLLYVGDGYELEVFVDRDFYTIYNIMFAGAQDEYLVNAMYDMNVQDGVIFNFNDKKGQEATDSCLEALLNYWDIPDGMGYTEDRIVVSKYSEYNEAAAGYIDDKNDVWAAVRFEDGIELPVHIRYTYVKNTFFWINIGVI